MSKTIDTVHDAAPDTTRDIGCKYIYWKWSKEGNIQPIKSLRHRGKSTIKREVVMFPPTQQEEVNKREVCNSRISQRDPMIQTRINPYMIDSDYLNDLGVQDHYLRPQDSNY